MKRNLLIGFRALVFAIGAFALLAATSIKVRSSLDVAGFILGLAALWVLFEKVFLGRKPKPSRKS